MSCGYEVIGDICIMRFSCGFTAIIDAVDVEFVQLRNWCVDRKTQRVISSGAHTINLGRYLLGIKVRGIYADHINHNAADNRRCNLREATPSQNRQNCRRQQTNRLYKGVSLRPNGTYSATVRLTKNGFVSAEEAAKAYDRMAIQYFGDYAALNFGQSVTKASGRKQGSTTISKESSPQVSGETGTNLHIAG